MDLLMGRFADATITDWSEADCDAMEQVMRVPDPELYAWITEQAEIPENHRWPILDRVIAFHKGAS